MLAITLADLRFRLRQFLIAGVGAGVVFAMALLLTGMVKGFYNEVTRTVASAQADVWVLPEGRISHLADAVVELSPNGHAVDREPEDITLADGQTLFRQGDPATSCTS
jgi:hypothetical protein